jgi:hypothetical protein
MITINLVSGPRNLSTALLYSFAQRPDTRVVDEPFYACYLQHTGLAHPGREEVIASQPTDSKDVMAALFDDVSKPVLFIKNMAHHQALVTPSFLEMTNNIFLIRNPRQILSSYAQVIDTPTLRDIGIDYQCTLFHHLSALGRPPIVLDSGLLLQNPEGVLTRLCERLEIPYAKEMLRWPPGPKPYDGVWAKYWYGNVHTSTGFAPQPSSNRPLPAHLAAVHREAQYYYQALLPFSILP